MKRIYSLIMVICLLLTSAQFAYAAPKNNTNVLAVDGGGYKVYTNQDGAKKDNFISSFPTVQPDSISNWIVSADNTWHTSSTFTTSQAFGNGNLVEYGNVSIKDAHVLVGNDTVNIYGVGQAGWTGTSPSINCDQIAEQPSESIYASSTYYSISVPAGVSFSQQSDSMTYTWNSVSLANKYQNNYYWASSSSPIVAQTSGHFTSVITNDTGTFTFGVNTYGVTNTINATISN